MVASKLLPDCSGLSPMCIACLLLDCFVSVLLEEHIEASETCQGRPRAGYILSHPRTDWEHSRILIVFPRGVGNPAIRRPSGLFDAAHGHALRLWAHPETCFWRGGSADTPV